MAGQTINESEFLEDLASLPPVSDGSHNTYRVKRMNAQGEVESGYYKKLDDNYPPFIALLSVAASYLLSVIQHSGAVPHDYLVFDKDGKKLLGTWSKEIAGFRPFNFSSEDVPEDPKERKWACPDVDTLVELNMMAIILARILGLDEGDGHMHNLGTALGLDGKRQGAHIDLDEAFRRIAKMIKGYPSTVRPPKGIIPCWTTEDYANFPNIVNPDNRAIHQVTNAYAGQDNLYGEPLTGPASKTFNPKTNDNYEAFKALSGDKRAQLQKFKAVLSFLLTYQPRELTMGLEQRLGKQLTNFTALDKETVAYFKSTEGFKDYFTVEANLEPFSKFILEIFEGHYRSVRHVMVFFKGMVNKAGLALPSAREELYQHGRDAFNEVMEFAERENQRLHPLDKKPPSPLAPEADSEEQAKYKEECRLFEQYKQLWQEGLPFDKDAIRRRYHDIYRGAHAEEFSRLFRETYNLTNKLLERCSTCAAVNKLEPREPTLECVDTIWLLFNEVEPIPEITKDSLSVGTDHNPMFTALQHLAQFTNNFRQALIDYYRDAKEEELSDDHNRVFIAKIEALISSAANNTSKIKRLDEASQGGGEITRLLGSVTDYAERFTKVVRGLSQLSKHANFVRHLEPHSSLAESGISRSLTFFSSAADREQSINLSDRIAKQLFETTINDLDSQEFKTVIEDTLNGYSKSSSWLRYKKPLVEAYLAVVDIVKPVSNQEKLAYILRLGTPDGALNTFLVGQLIERMHARQDIRSLPSTRDMPSIRSAIVTLAGNYLLSSEDKLLYKTMYEWIQNKGKESFTALVNEVIIEQDEAASMLSYFWSPASKREWGAHLNSGQRAEGMALAMFQGKDGSPPSPWSQALFKALIKAMQNDFRVIIGPLTEEQTLIQGFNIENPNWIEIGSRKLQHYSRQLKKLNAATVLAQPAAEDVEDEDGFTLVGGVPSVAVDL